MADICMESIGHSLFELWSVEVVYETVSSSAESAPRSDFDVTEFLQRYLQDEKLRNGSCFVGKEIRGGYKKRERLPEKEKTVKTVKATCEWPRRR